MPLNQLKIKHLSSAIIEKAKDIGFFDCGISKAELLADEQKKMDIWLDKGYQGEMKYLEKNKEKRYDPSLLVENAKSVISVLYNYYPEKELKKTNNYNISKYAYGIDYHYVIKEKLKTLQSFIEEKTESHNYRIFVDSAPVLDRAWAKRSGLGFIGKNTLLINKKGGSYFFIGHIITELELKYFNAQSMKNHCGKCTRCIDACPTGAIHNNILDARKCLSYITIEYRGKINSPEKEAFNNYIYGCDICQDVCPWNRFATPHSEPMFDPSSELMKMTIDDWQNIDKQTFKKLFKSSAVKRTRYEGLRRNINYLMK